MIITKAGYAIKFNSTEIGTSSRTTSGIKGINLNKEDEVVCTLVIRHDTDNLTTFTKNGLGKRTSLSEFPIQKKAGKGLICHKTEELATATLTSNEDSILICGNRKSICIEAAEIPIASRNTIGVAVIKDDSITSVSKV